MLHFEHQIMFWPVQYKSKGSTVKIRYFQMSIKHEYELQNAGKERIRKVLSMFNSSCIAFCFFTMIYGINASISYLS